MALRLFEHNEKAYHAAVRMMEQYGKAAIVHPTGTGKSYIAFKLIEDNPKKVVLWLSPSEYIFKTQLESLKRSDPKFPLANVHFYTYAKLMCCTQEQLDAIAAQKPAYIILDEFHRAGAECWGESAVALLKLCPDAKLLGLTATNIRYLDNNRDMAEELFDSRVASDMTLGEAVVRGILPAPKYVTTVYQYQKALAKYQARVDNLRTPGIQDANQKYLDALRRALEQADGLDKVFAHHIINKSGKYIVFCANKEHMDEMVSHVPEWFAGVNPNVAVYEAYSDDPNTDKSFADFKMDRSNRLKLLFCIDMLNEGVHVEGISGVILFRPTISPIIYNKHAEPWKVTVVDTGLNTQTGGRIKRVKDYVGDETFMVTYGDAVSDVNIPELLAYHKAHGKIGTMSMYNFGQSKGVVDIGADGNIKAFREKSDFDGDLINIGYMVFEPKLFDYIAGDDTVFEKEPLCELVKENQLAGYVHKGFWQCMDTLREKQQLEKLWASGNAPWKLWEE